MSAPIRFLTPFAAACRRSPFFFPLLGLWLARELVLAFVSFVDAGAGGEASVAFLMHSGYYLGESLLLLALCESLRSLLPRLIWVPVAVLVLFGAMLLSLIDPILYKIIGDRLSPSVLRQFVGWRLFVDSDFWQPVIANWLPVSIAVLSVTAFLYWVGRTLLRGARQAEAMAARHILASACVGLAGMLGTTWVSAVPLMEPVEVLFIKEWTGGDLLAYSAAERQTRVEALRTYLGLPRGARWKDGRYPLIYEFVSPKAPAADPPDVFVFVVESLRGENFAPSNQNGSHLADTPNMSALARKGVAFSRYLSNGFPSGPGYIAISYSSWPHIRKRIVAEFAKTPLDGIAQRLSTLGYHTLHVEAEPGFDKLDTWVSHYRSSLIVERPDGRGDDVQLADTTLDWLRKWDANQAVSGRRQALFTLYLTKDPHLPYRYREADGKGLTSGPSLVENYRRSLHYVDAQLGRIFDYLGSRPRARNTVIVITGDHANFLDQQETRSFPINDTVWSAAVISGPENLIGPARGEHGIASQVDLMPTISALIGDERASAALGRNLLHDDGRPRGKAMTIRSGGLRYETDRGGILVDAVMPRGAMPSGGIPSAPTRGGDQSVDLTARQVHALASTWSYLLEHGEIWDPALLAGNQAKR